MLHISTFSNEVRVSVTYLITIALINNRKIDSQWDFRFRTLAEITKLNVLQSSNHKIK